MTYRVCCGKNRGHRHSSLHVYLSIFLKKRSFFLLPWIIHFVFFYSLDKTGPNYFQNSSFWIQILWCNRVLDVFGSKNEVIHRLLTPHNAFRRQPARHATHSRNGFTRLTRRGRRGLYGRRGTVRRWRCRVRQCRQGAAPARRTWSRCRQRGRTRARGGAHARNSRRRSSMESMASSAVVCEAICRSSAPFSLPLLTPVEEVAEVAIITAPPRSHLCVCFSMTCGPKHQRVNVSQLGMTCQQNQGAKPLQGVK